MTTTLSNSRSWKQGVFSFLLLLSFATTAQAATLSLDPESGGYGPGDMFVVTVRLDTAPGECINAATVELLYSTDWMKATAVSKGESLMTLWADEPVMDTQGGKVTFSGGIPAGYCGRVQGDPGKTNILAKIAFSIPGNMIGGKVSSGPTPMSVAFGPSTKVLLNDGFGTEAPLTKTDASFIHNLSSSGIKNEWLEIVHGDTVPPDEFKIAIAHDPTAFSGKYFIVFTTVDKQSGVHHFEVREDDPGRLGYMRGKNVEAPFAITSSPFVLKDQELKSRIMVRAVDNAGNVREAILPPSSGAFSPSAANQVSAMTTQSTAVWRLFFLVSLILVMGAGLWIYTLMAKKKFNEGEMSKTDEPQ